MKIVMARSSQSATLEDKKADDEIAYSGPDKLRKATVPEGIEEGQSIRNCGVPIGILGRESREPRGQRGMDGPSDEGAVSASSLHQTQGFQQEHDDWRVAGRHDSHHGLCEHATSSSAPDDRVSEVKSKLSTTHVTAC